MFKTLILKEIHESILNFRFWMVTVLCMLLIPFGLYIASKDYVSRLNEYQADQMKYIEQSKGEINGGVEIQGFFPPSPLSILSSGFKDHLPAKVITSNDGFERTEKKLQDSNLQSVLFGKIDFVFIVTNFLSLLALIFTFGAVSTEKEQGTLKLLLSNPVNRWKLIIAKITGHYIVFLAPLIISLITGILVIQFTTGVNFLIKGNLTVLLTVLLFTMVFLFMFFCMGIWASVISKSTITSIIVLLFIWIFISVGIPRISPMVAQIVSPIKTEDAYQKDCQSLKQQIEDQFDNERRELLRHVINENNVIVESNSGFPNLSEIAEVKTNYTEQAIPVEEKYRAKLRLDLGNLEEDYSNSRFRQMTIATNLSRISPISSYTFLTSELCNTGILEFINRQDIADKFQFQANQDVYSHYIAFRYVYEGLVNCGTKENVDKLARNIAVPVLTQYSTVPLNIITKKIWPDIVLLIWYTIFFFTGSFVSFLRFDVR